MNPQPVADQSRRSFHVELIKPSHYDDDGYVIQWRISFIPSNSLATVYGLVDDVRRRGSLGVDIDLRAYDETHTVIPVRRIIHRIRRAGGRGVVFLTGVQSNQFPRALDIARPLRAAGIQVAIGGFHISGCIAMLPELPADIRAAQELGISLFAGEAEGRIEQVLADAVQGRMKPVYDFMDDLPDLQSAVVPFLPSEVTRRYMRNMTSFDAGRGCPFQCSFCTIINVQGRRSRWRTPDDVEHIVRAGYAQGIRRYFITDDNFARNGNWEAILDRLIALRRAEGIKVKLILQVDTLCHRIPGFIPKARAAGTNRVFIGLENINPANLKIAKKHQNRVAEYREMLQAWRSKRVLTHAGYILGFPEDTPESVANDIETIKRELPVDILEFFILTPLPGSEDHRELDRKRQWMDEDLNKYDLEHATTIHPRMDREVLQEVYWRAWHQYYTWDHIETLMRRAEAGGIKARRAMNMVMEFYGSLVYERVHPLQCGLWRIKRRTDRRPGMKRVHPLAFYPTRAWEWLSTYSRATVLYLRLRSLKRRIERDPLRLAYRDAATSPPPADRAEETMAVCGAT
jgi:radical SAM superfamily enzyme YgiQ (UPF0313 family)